VKIILTGQKPLPIQGVIIKNQTGNHLPGENIMEKIGKEIPTRPRLVLPFLALALSGVLLLAWIRGVSAQKTDPSWADAAPVNSPVVEQSLIKHAVQGPIHPDNSEDRQDLAPTAGYDLAISKSQLPQTFTVGSNNRYIINVSRINTETVTSTIIVEDELPVGMTWVPPTTAGKWDCTTSTTTKVNCFYADSIPESLIAFEPINVIVNVSTSIAPQVSNTAKLINGGSNSANDQATIITNIRSADLEIEKTQKPSPVPSQDTIITYTIVITNNGPSLASNVLVTDTLPSELNPYQAVTGYPMGRFRSQP
jgi:uncharacterized repeat protein (TIGR01451 family)